MKVRVGIQRQEKANRFLRALWAELRTIFPKQDWQFTPSRSGKFKRITFGQVDFGIEDGPIMVGVSYKKRGGIESVFFERPFGKAVETVPSLVELVEAAVCSALTRAEHTSCLLMQAAIQPAYSQMSEYRGESFVIKSLPERRFLLAIPVGAYDKVDAQAGFRLKASCILDVLAVETNVPFWQMNEAELSKLEKSKFQEVFIEDPNWVDSTPTRDGCMILSREGKQLLDLIAADEADPESQIIFLRACRHFHMALRLNALSCGIHDYNERQENITVLYVSSLEVASIIEGPKPSPCPECGQPVYKIRQRVSDLASAHLADHIVKFIKSYYDRRSKYLHAGILLSNQDYAGTILPQLDAASPTGCVDSLAPSSIMNLQEFTSYCLRQVLKSLVRAA